MSRNRTTVPKAKRVQWYRGTDVPMTVIRRFARRVAERFRPTKIVLFGEHAYGTPHADSDVDILVIMPARNQLDQAFKIHSTLLPDFPLDIIVRTPQRLESALKEGCSFHSEIVARGKVLYEKSHARLGAKGGSRLSARRNHRARAAVLS